MDIETKLEMEGLESNYHIAKELADTLEYYQDRYLITEDDTVIVLPTRWDEVYFKIRINTRNSNLEKKKIIYTKELIKLIQENLLERQKLLKINDYRYLYDNTVEQYVPPIMKVMSTPLTITIFNKW